MSTYPILLVFPAAMVFAAAYDLFTMKIPNKISIVLVLAFLLAAPFSGLPWATIGAHLAVGGAALVFGFVAFTRGWAGGGDAKLLAAAALWMGTGVLLDYLVAVALLGGVLSVTILLFRNSVPPAFVRGPHWLVRLHSKDSGVPYGIAIGGAALLLFPHSALFIAAA